VDFICWQRQTASAQYPAGLLLATVKHVKRRTVPPIPEKLRGKQYIVGQALWNVSCPELANSSVRSSARQDETDELRDLENVFSAQKTFKL
jgi:hypothetical protein